MSGIAGLLLDNPGLRAVEKPAHTPERLKEVSSQFESLLIASMFKQMRESGSGEWSGGSEDKAGATAIEYAEEAMAQAIASKGGLGLSAMIERSLRQADKVADKT